MSPVSRRSLFAVIAVALAFSLFLPTASAVSYDRPQATVYTIDVDENGDATWTIELRYQLVDDDDVEEFESIQEEFEEGELVVFEGMEESMEPFADEASEATDRPMSINDFERNVEIRDSVTSTEGVVSISFDWTGFADADGDELRVGDVFVGSGLALTGNERLVLEFSGDIPLDSVSPEPDTNEGDRMVWDGERFFEEGQPSVVFAESTDDRNGTDEPSSAPYTTTTIVAGLLVLLSGFAGGLYLSRATGIMGRKEEDEEEDGDEDGDEAEVNTSLLSDEERVVRILKKNGGKMKQAEIVEQTDWSKSKVSMLLSNMEEDGKISKLRLGRENVIELEDDADAQE